MAQIDKQKMGALLAKHGKPQAPPKKPGGGGGPPPGKQQNKPPQGPPHQEKPKEEEQPHVDVHEIAEKISNGDGDPELMDLAAQIHGDEVPDFVSDEGKWHKAVSLVEPIADDVEDKEAVVLHVYVALGGKVDKEGGGDHEEPDGDEGGGGEHEGGDGGE